MFPSGPISRILFFLSVIIISLGIFYLIAWRLSAIFGFHFSSKKLLLGAILLVMIFMLGMMLHNIAGKGGELIGTGIVWLIYTLWFITPLVIIIDIVRIWYPLPLTASMISIIIWIGLGIYFGTQTKITQLNIESPKISKEATIIFISDLHVSQLLNKTYINAMVTRIKTIKPDVVIMGGDLMNSAKSEYVSAFLPFNTLDIPVYATLGNHDHMGDKNAIPQLFEKTKIIPLRNQLVSFENIQIVGVDDKSYRSGASLDNILQKIAFPNTENFTILTIHQPVHLSKIAKYPIDLELAGHTHNGQFIPLTWMITLFNDYAYGLYQNGDQRAFVSQGIGLWGAPMRMGTQSEMVVIHLKPAKK